MFFSIVVPVFNVENYIRECLDSISNQTFKNFEVILVDDGSTDNSGLICDEYASNDIRFIVIHKTNEGLLLARRTGIKKCRGDYIVHCDSDDYLEVSLLEKIRKAIDNTGSDMVMYGYDIVDNAHNVIENHYDTFDSNKFFGKKEKELIIRELTSTTWLNNMWSKATRRQCVDFDIDYTKYKELKMGEDLFQVIPCVANCQSFVYIAEPLYHYRKNDTGMSKNISTEYIINHVTVGKRTENYLRTANISNDILIGFYNRYVRELQKYLIRFLMSGIDRTQYKNLFFNATRNSVYINAMNSKELWLSNKLLNAYLNPAFFRLTHNTSKIVFHKQMG